MEMNPGDKRQETRDREPDVRFLNDMRKVLYDKEWAKTAPDLELYYMYRGVEERDDLRYDITVIPPKMLGQEFVKTKGHEHSGPFQELYVVLEGEAIFLMQKYKEGAIEDVLAVKTKKGEAVIIPQDYGHVTINPSKTPLKVANWINKKCENVYELFRKMEGACYYYTKSGWIKNKNYKTVPKLRFGKALKSMPTNLDFLK